MSSFIDASSSRAFSTLDFLGLINSIGDKSNWSKSLALFSRRISTALLPPVASLRLGALALYSEI